MNQLIREAFTIHGFTADVEEGKIFNAQGLELVQRIHKKSRRPRVRLPHPTKRRFEFHSHRVFGYLVFGELAFDPRFHIVHLNGDHTNIKASNLALVTFKGSIYLDKSRRHKRFISRFSPITKRLRPGKVKNVQTVLMSDDLIRFMVEQRRQERAVFKRLKSDFHLRAQMLPLIDDLRGLIEDHAVELVTFKTDDNDPWMIDDMEHRLLWLLTEYLSGDTINTSEAFDHMPTVGQLTPVHIAAHLNLNVSFYSDGWLVSTGDEAHV